MTDDDLAIDDDDLQHRLEIADARSAAHADAFKALVFVLVDAGRLDPRMLRNRLSEFVDAARYDNRHPEWATELRRIAADLPLTAPPPPSRKA